MKTRLLRPTMIFIFCFVIMGLIFQSIAMAKPKDTRFPRACVQTGYSFKLHTLRLHPLSAGKPQSIYLIHNLSKRPVKLFYMVTGNESYIMHLNNEIRPNQWGAFASDEEVVNFACAAPSNSYGHRGDYRVVNCKKVLELCEYPNAKFATNNYGNYWAISSNTKYGARNSVIRQGVFLK